MRQLGWLIHRAVDHFPNDAQDVDDDVWMRYGLAHRWFPLHKDGRIRGREVERRPLIEFEAPMFYLDNQQLKIDEMARRFHHAQHLLRDAIERCVMVAERVAVRAILAHALHEEARDFYAHFDFEPSPTDPLDLLLVIKDARAALGFDGP